jgi:hypothetical protein
MRVLNEGIRALKSIDFVSRKVSSGACANMSVLRDQIHRGFLRRDPLYVKTIFDEHCEKNSASMSKSKIFFALKKLGIDIDSKRATELFDEFDCDFSRGMDLEEFKILLQRSNRLNQWAEGLLLHDLLTDSIPRKAEQDPMRLVSELTVDEIALTCRAFQDGLIGLLSEACASLKQAFIVSDARKAQSTEGSKFNLGMNCGNIDEFHQGVEERIGACAVRAILDGASRSVD